MAMSFGGVSKQKVATVIVAADGTGDVIDIQAGINLLPAGGGVVYVKEGTYSSATQITFPNDNISVIGAGKATIITSTSTNRLFYITKDGCYLEKLYLYTASQGAGTSMIEFNGSSNSTVLNCWFKATTGTGCLRLGNITLNCTVLGCKFFESSAFSLMITGNSGWIVAADNIFYSNSNTSLYAATGGELTVANNVFDNNTDDDIEFIDTVLRSIINGNVFTRTTGIGVKITNANCLDNLIVGNMFYNNTTNLSDSGTRTEFSHNIEA